MGRPGKGRLLEAFSPSPQPFSPRYSGYPAARAQSQEPASTQPWPLGATHSPGFPLLARAAPPQQIYLHGAHDTGPVSLARPPRTTVRSPARLPTHCAQAAVARVQQVRRAQSPSCPAGERGRQSRVQSSGAEAGGCLGLSGLAALPKGPRAPQPGPPRLGPLRPAPSGRSAPLPSILTFADVEILGLETTCALIGCRRAGSEVTAALAIPRQGEPQNGSCQKTLNAALPAAPSRLGQSPDWAWVSDGWGKTRLLPKRNGKRKPRVGHFASPGAECYKN
ncbi:hypothetical protein NN561_010435 [Cricetulus griseus]